MNSIYNKAKQKKKKKKKIEKVLYINKLLIIKFPFFFNLLLIVIL